MAPDYGKYFNLNHIESESMIYGPGKRFVIWFQGCALACSGCWNSHMWSFKANLLINRNDLLNRILSKTDIRGITLIGGEPLYQSKNLWWLLESIRNLSGLTIFLYTGYEIEEIKSMGFYSRIEKLCDIVVVGRYKKNLRNINRQWIGSDNQQVIYPTNSRENYKPKPINEVEIIIRENGGMTILGFPNKDLID